MLKILGHYYKLVKISEDKTDNWGLVHEPTQTISIRGDLPVEHQEAMVLHEILEVLNCLLELDLSHQTISILSEILQAVLKDNNVDLSPLLKYDG